MSTEKLSGYLATAITVAFNGTQVLNSLTDNEWTSLSDEIDNTTNKYPYCDIDLVLGSAAFATPDCGIEVYFVPTVDGTNYPDWSDNATTDFPENMHYYVAFLPVKASTSAKRIVSSSQSDIEFPQGKFKVGIRSRANVNIAGSGNTLYLRPKSYDVV
jgi:plasmid stabilization system protein ParE